MSRTKSFSLKGEELSLLPEKAIFWEKESCLLLADLHLGKVTHFRKSGFAVPQAAKNATLDRLEDLLLRYNPREVLFLGDLFHSDYNVAWIAFNDLIERYAEIKFVLVEGNHDILEKSMYEGSRLTHVAGYLKKGPFLLSHEPLETPSQDGFNLCGHIHPGVRLTGKALQSLRLPCFYFGDHTGILPAFGTFTGCAVIKPLKGDKVFVVTKKEVIQVQ